MRSSFGRLAQEIREKRGIIQSDFASRIGESLPWVSDLEHRRTNINEAFIARYIVALECSGGEISALREHANLSNSSLAAENRNLPHSTLHALLAHFGERLSDTTAAGIRQLLVAELGPQVAILEFSGRRSPARTGTRAIGNKAASPDITARRFIDLCLLAERSRTEYSHRKYRLNIETFLAKAGMAKTALDVDIREGLPSYADGAFVCLVGHADGHTILITKDGYQAAVRGNPVHRHAICHEFAHHILHGALLQTEGECHLPVQDLAKPSGPSRIQDRGPTGQTQDTVIDVEAECFATMLLVPWGEFLKGTLLCHLAADFGAQQGEVERCARYVRNPAVLTEFRKTLWDRGERKHPIFLRGE